MVELWNTGTLEHWNTGTLEKRPYAFSHAPSSLPPAYTLAFGYYNIIQPLSLIEAHGSWLTAHGFYSVSVRKKIESVRSSYSLSLLLSLFFSLRRDHVF
ncbi:MAG: hypothetical protein RBU28_10310, partial [Bacteroidales bacterium]|nr:hypothetical protein [Bacteroidales bacterium]